jgi:hypothetical protein
MKKEDCKKGILVYHLDRVCKVTKTLGATCEVQPIAKGAGQNPLLIASIRSLVKVEDKDIPKKETPKKETPKKETPKKDTPKKDIPKKETPKKDAPKVGKYQAKEERALKVLKLEKKIPTRVANFDVDMFTKIEAISKVMKSLPVKERATYKKDLRVRDTEEANFYFFALFVRDNAKAFKNLRFKTELEDYLTKHENVSDKVFKLKDTKKLLAYTRRFKKTGLYDYRFYDEWIKEYKGCKNIYLVFKILTRDVSLKLVR